CPDDSGQGSWHRTCLTIRWLNRIFSARISWDAGQRGSQGDTSPCIGVRGRSPVNAGAARKKPSRRDDQPACKAGIRHTQPRRCGHINAAQAGLPARIVTKMSLLRGQRKQRPQKRRPEGRLFFLSCRTAAARTLTSQRYLKNLDVVELVRSVLRTARFQSVITREVLFVIVTDVRTRHVLVLNTSDTLTDFFTLYASHVTQHTGFAEVFFGQVVHRQSSGVVSRQSDQVVEDVRFT